MQRIRKFLSLSAGEQRLFISALFLLPLIVLAVRLMGYRRTESLLLSRTERHDEPTARSEDLASAMAAACTVRRAADHGLVRANCLPRALLLQRVLRRKGIDCDIRFGVNGDHGDLEAHAWVEFDGVRIDGDSSPPDRYLQLKAAGRKRAGVVGRGNSDVMS